MKYCWFGADLKLFPDVLNSSLDKNIPLVLINAGRPVVRSHMQPVDVGETVGTADPQPPLAALATLHLTLPTVLQSTQHHLISGHTRDQAKNNLTFCHTNF